jgi:hypothetical protein
MLKPGAKLLSQRERMKTKGAKSQRSASNPVYANIESFNRIKLTTLIRLVYIRHSYIVPSDIDLLNGSKGGGPTLAALKDVLFNIVDVTYS